MKVYIAGPMTGYPDLNFPAFNALAAALRAGMIDTTVVNPAEINADTTMAWAECMKRDIVELVTCDVIHCLPGWRKSRGATLEVHIAEALGILRVGAWD
jgi:hypothetical protein